MRFALWEKITFGLLIAAWAVYGSGLVGDFLVHPGTLEKPAYVVGGVETAKKEQVATVAKAADNALAMLASASADKGKKAFGKCKSCHTVTKGGKNGVGPNLWDIVGRDKAAAEGYNFSDALKGKGGNWTFADLDAFIARPKAFVPKTKMGFGGLKSAGKRADLMAFLRSLSDSPKPLPSQ